MRTLKKIYLTVRHEGRQYRLDIRAYFREDFPYLWRGLLTFFAVLLTIPLAPLWFPIHCVRWYRDVDNQRLMDRVIDEVDAKKGSQ